MRVPSSMPAGMLTDSERSSVTRPWPAHLRAGVLDRLAAALACRAGALDREEALAARTLPWPPHMRAGHRLRAGLGAGAGAIGAGDRGRHPDLRGLAGIGFLQRDLHVVAQVGAALAAAGRAAAAAPPIMSPKMSSKMSEKPPPPKPVQPPPSMPPFSKAAWPKRS